MYLCKRNSGYGLLALLIVLIGLVSSALGVQIYKESKRYLLQDELILETLHQTRVGVMQYYQDNRHWPAPPFIGFADEYVESIELIDGNEPALRVRLYGQERATRIQPHLAASWVQGDYLWLRLATESAANIRDRALADAKWLRREDNKPAVMNTHLGLANYALENTDSLFVQDLDSESLTGVELITDQLNSSSFTITHLNSTELSSATLTSSQLQTDRASAQEIAVGLARINDALEIGSWQQQQIQMQQTTAQEASFANVTVQNVATPYLRASSANIANLQADSIQAPLAQVGNVDANLLNYSQGSADLATFQTVATNNLNTSNATVGNISVTNPVELRGFHAENLDSMHASLDALYRNLYNCVYHNRWCEAPKATNLSLQSCQGCNQEQNNEQFLATINVSGNECVHGCEFEISATDASSSCSPVRVNPLENGNTQCTVSKSLAPGESWQQLVRVRARNRKNLNVWGDLLTMINWHRTVGSCESLYVNEPIQGTEPLTFATLVFAETAAGNTATASASGLGCATGGSEWSCSGVAQCNSAGVWQNVQTYCSCGF